MDLRSEQVRGKEGKKERKGEGRKEEGENLGRQKQKTRRRG